MSTEDEKQARQAQAFRGRAASLSEGDLVLWLFNFERMVHIETRLEMLGGPAPPDEFRNMSSATILGILRVEMRSRLDEKSRGTP